MNLKLLVIPFLSLFIGIPAIGQNCNCKTEFVHLKDQITQNYAGFQDKATNTAYLVYTKAIAKATEEVTTSHHCALLMADWLTFFLDRHIQLGENPLSAADLQKIVATTESIHLTKKQLNKLPHSKSVEGVYWSSDSADCIAIIKSPNSVRDFAGVIISSKTTGWKPGQVKLELRPSNRKNELLGITYDTDHTPYLETFSFDTHTLGAWQREGTVANNEDASTESVTGKLLSDQTLYLRIRSFDQSNAANIDSLFKTYKVLLHKTPNLIIDIRNNGGGSDFTYAPVTPYLYTNPVQKIGVDVLATEQNINAWKALLKMNDLPAAIKKHITDVTEEMEQHKGTFVSTGPDETVTSDSISTCPKKIAILINSRCASTAEEFLMEAIQSKKVTLMGEATAGVLDYANMRQAPAFPCLPYTLYYATTRSRRVNIGKGIDNTGIQPAVKLSPTLNWITAAQQFLEK